MSATIPATGPAAPVTPPVTAPGPPPPPAGVVVVSIVSLILLAVALAVATWMKNENAILLITGCIITNATTIVNWWVGSSKGSADKTALQSQQLQAMLPVVPVAPALVTPIIPAPGTVDPLRGVS
jgi:hypothetical protein